MARGCVQPRRVFVPSGCAYGAGVRAGVLRNASGGVSERVKTGRVEKLQFSIYFFSINERWTKDGVLI